MNKKLISAAILLVSLNAQAQSPEDTPKGRPIVKIFTNFHTGFGAANDDRGFELSRSYLGYEYDLNGALTVKGVLDVGQSKQVDDYQRIAYVKNMLLQWRHDRLTLKAGLIPTLQFGTQEKFWGLRYLHKSFQDEYKFGNSADLGLSVSYSFNEWLAADALVANGEGYKKVQFNDGLLYGAGVTLTSVSGLVCRLYGGFNQSVGKEETDLYHLATFIGYKNANFSFGGEYNFKKEQTAHVAAHPQGVSFYSTVHFNKNIGMFGRYDQLFSAQESQIGTNEKSALLGIEYTPNKYIKLAPTFTYKKKESNDSPEYYAGIYCYFGI